MILCFYTFKLNGPARGGKPKYNILTYIWADILVHKSHNLRTALILMWLNIHNYFFFFWEFMCRPALCGNNAEFIQADSLFIIIFELVLLTKCLLLNATYQWHSSLTHCQKAIFCLSYAAIWWIYIGSGRGIWFRENGFAGNGSIPDSTYQVIWSTTELIWRLVVVTTLLCS